MVIVIKIDLLDLTQLIGIKIPQNAVQFVHIGILAVYNNCRVIALLHKIIDVIFRFAVSITIFRVIIEVVVVLLVDHTEKFAIAVKNAACINWNPMDVVE